MILAWLKASGWFGLAKGAWVGIGVAVVLVIGWGVHHSINKHDQEQQTVGAQGAVIQGQTQTLNQLKDANDAQQNLKSDNGRSAERYRQCLLDSSRPAACERFNPNPK